MPNEKLHTERLEETYGPIIAEVLVHDLNIRESHLIDRRGISRTYALTFFPKKPHSKEIRAIDQEIKHGMPIGKAFSLHDYEIRKNTIDTFILEIPPWLSLAFDTKEKYAKVRLAEFYVKHQKSLPQIYGAVFEIYSPDFRKPIITHKDIATIQPSTEALEKQGLTKELIWKHIGKESPEHLKDHYLHAKKNTLTLIFELKKRLTEHLEKT